MGHTAGYQEVLLRPAIVPEAGPGQVDVAYALGYEVEAGMVDQNDH